MKRSTILAIALSLLASACGSSDAMRADAGVSDVVEMRLIAYRPETLDVSVGTTVTWRQLDAGVHTVTSGRVARDPSGSVTTHPDGDFTSDRLAKGEGFTYTFTDEGTYEYFCEIHPATMSGLVTVQ